MSLRLKLQAFIGVWCGAHAYCCTCSCGMCAGFFESSTCRPRLLKTSHLYCALRVTALGMKTTCDTSRVRIQFLGLWRSLLWAFLRCVLDMDEQGGASSAVTKKRRLLARVSSVGSEPDANWLAMRASPGLRSSNDLLEWPLDVMQSLCREEDEEIALRLRSHLLRGLFLDTDYSGIDCPREVLELGVAALQSVLEVQPRTEPVKVGQTSQRSDPEACSGAHVPHL